MSDLILNVETALPPHCARKSAAAAEGNKKHQRFVRRRHFLERKGFLRQKQLPPLEPLAPSWPKREASPGMTGTAAAEKDGKQARKAAAVGWEGPSSSSSGAQAKGRPPRALLRSVCEERALLLAPAKPSKMVALDCEMVGTGPGGRNSDLARCSVVSYQGDVVYDKYIRPLSPITNYRTRWSGIRRHHMANAVPFKAAQKEILKLLSGKIVIGHAIHNDFKALKYFHPKSLTRDTSRIPLLNRKAGFPENESASLKRLTKQLLHRDIQVGQNGHSSVEDARATMELYKVIEVEWERHLASCPPQD
ncbi:interferon-stimulated 20 kDa exonuclease-like 2 [Sceloporus undulatus]|uniref:interferon-stimulated 20 kDa exonuclease-like 2 n=1 Tax=Sceloporus undulatus TaxID=8520 RepID=UPI001C4B8DBA|nr:interferon-stimulated 20 kDa exonuclease-like 2 [Sceloporus undulatus]